MPWVKRKKGDRWAIYKQGQDGEPTGETLGMHDTEDEANGQLAALYASEQRKSIKFVDEEAAEIEGLLLPYGGSFNGRDLDGEYFTKRTNFCLDWYQGDRPLLHNHGLDDDAGVTVIGRIKGIDLRDDGGWMRAQLDKRTKYFSAIARMIKDGQLNLSSGAMAHLVRKDGRTGELLRWPVVEGSTTPTPSNLLATVDLATADKHFKAAGLDLLDPNALKVLQESIDSAGGVLVNGKAEMAAEQRTALDDSDFAYVDSQGGRHLPMNDAAHARNALARFEQTSFESDGAKQKAKRKLLARCKELGVEVSDEMKAAKMGKPMMRRMMVEMASEMGMEMADDEMAEMMDGLDADMPDDEMRGQMRKKMQARKRMMAEGKSASVKALSGSYEELIERLSAMVNPPNPFAPANRWTSIEATFPDYVIARIREPGGETIYRVAYTLDADGKPKLGEATEVEQTYTPAAPETQAVSTQLQALAVAKSAAALSQCTKDLTQRRVKEGRVLSTVNRNRLAECLASMRTAVDDLAALLDSTEPQTAKAASVWRQLRARNLEAFAQQLATVQ